MCGLHQKALSGSSATYLGKMPRCHVSPARPRRRPSPAPCGADTSLRAPGEGAEKASNSSPKCPGGGRGSRCPRAPRLPGSGAELGGPAIPPVAPAPLHFSLQRFPRSPSGPGAPLGARHPRSCPCRGEANPCPPLAASVCCALLWGAPALRADRREQPRGMVFELR